MLYISQCDCWCREGAFVVLSPLFNQLFNKHAHFLGKNVPLVEFLLLEKVPM